MTVSLRERLLPTTHVNKCKHCRITHLCLPARMDKQTLRKENALRFQTKILRPGEHLTRQGQPAKYLYALRSGIVKSYLTQEDGTEHIMGFHLTAEVIGWEGINDDQLTPSIVALDQCNICLIPIDKLNTLSQTQPELQAQLLHLASQRIYTDNLALLRGNAQQRVASFLLQLRRSYTRLGYPKDICYLKMTQQDIGNYLGLAAETISRTIKQLQQARIIHLDQKKITIYNIDRLKALAHLT